MSDVDALLHGPGCVYRLDKELGAYVLISGERNEEWERKLQDAEIVTIVEGLGLNPILCPTETLGSES